MIRAMILLATLLSAFGQGERTLYRLERSSVSFKSEAPLETITATNTKSTGVLDATARTFAVQVPITEFQGFNSPLQREHFNENYLESSTHPKATFTGRIIETIDLLAPGTHSVRAKGELTVKGVTRERIVPCDLVVGPTGVRITTSFDVALDEHDIRVPRVVQQKIAPVVQVKVDVLFTRKP
ncbi:MAG: YceI family protein [Flavobacteriales bacterium]|nr:YceI family protein [Flavobacteriales bacterium]